MDLLQVVSSSGDPSLAFRWWLIRLAERGPRGRDSEVPGRPPDHGRRTAGQLKNTKIFSKIVKLKNTKLKTIGMCITKQCCEES